MGRLSLLRALECRRAGAEGHVESGYLVRGSTEAEARAAAGRLSLREAKHVLDALVRAAQIGG